MWCLAQVNVAQEGIIILHLRLESVRPTIPHLQYLISVHVITCDVTTGDLVFLFH